MLWFAATVTIAGVFRSVNPQFALDAAGHDARARTALANLRLASEQTPENIAQAEQLARGALKRDPASAEAMRVLGMIAALREEPRAQQLFEAAERLSRRDLATQMWLIEEKVRRDDVEGALRHYDTALRTSENSRPILIPVLVAATAEDGLVTPVAELVAKDPPWRTAFFWKFVPDVPPNPNAARFIDHVKRAGVLPTPGEMGQLAQRLADARQFDAAWRVYNAIPGKGGQQRAGIRNGTFADMDMVPPFNWHIETGTNFGADVRPREDGGEGNALQVYTSSGRGGGIARQLLLLPPGSHSLSLVAGASEGDRPAQLFARIECGNEQASRLVNLELGELAPRVARRSASFQVPASGCAAQWLNLGVQPDYHPGTVTGWVSDIRVSRR